MLEPELSSGTVVVAREQTQGRGRREREWLSAANENLTFSLLLRIVSRVTRLPAACECKQATRCEQAAGNPWKTSSVSMAAAVAVAELLEAEGVKADLKWPNDVLVGGKKICGILSEAVSGGVIIGIGLNVNMDSAGHIDQPATSLLMETGERRVIDDLLEKLLPILSARLGEWEQGGFSKVRKNWEAKVPTLGKTVTVRDGDAVRTGVLHGFGDDGELLLEENGVLSPIWAGDLSV